MRRNNLLRAQDDRETKRRQDELKTQMLSSYVNKDNMLHGNYKYDDRAENVRRERAARQRMEEEGKLEMLYTAHKQNEFTQAQALEDAKISAHIERTEKERERQARVVQRIKNESEELRWLAEKLSAAEMNLERKLQCDEKKIIQNRERAYEAAFDDLMENERMKKVVAEEVKEKNRRDEQIGARLVLEEQMEEKLEMQRAAQKEFVRERAAVDEIVARIQQEDQNEMLRKKEKQDETRMWVEQFLIEREAQREAARQRELDEEARIKEYGEEVEMRRAEAEARAKAKREEEARVQAGLGKEKEEQMRKAEEMENLLNALHFEEQEAKYRAAEKAKSEKQAKARVEMMQANEYQKELKNQRKQREREEEEEYRARMAQKYAEDARLEEENKLRREQRMAGFKEEVEQLAEHKRAMYEEQKRREIAEHAQMEEEEDERKRIVEQERQRMLREHAVKLIEYLPKGVLQKQEDLEMLIDMLEKRMGM
eukprot:CAMPEP_0197847500 /NCGR_PEP_ID=MMETSP1438-20131217/6345_1 /TAXON_ID=1461541 /ORGANISM="Pterosperma sp., Strain CCMP1384" /LENGTH=483 /DNA_ID=CAMNT_0043459441 /DNA_START=190 /DNA_END=1641 /DNA_ORIENTATION=+